MKWSDHRQTRVRKLNDSQFNIFEFYLGTCITFSPDMLTFITFYLHFYSLQSSSSSFSLRHVSSLSFSSVRVGFALTETSVCECFWFRSVKSVLIIEQLYSLTLDVCSLFSSDTYSVSSIRFSLCIHCCCFNKNSNVCDVKTERERRKKCRGWECETRERRGCVCVWAREIKSSTLLTISLNDTSAVWWCWFANSYFYSACDNSNGSSRSNERKRYVKSLINAL